MVATRADGPGVGVRRGATVRATQGCRHVHELPFATEGLPGIGGVVKAAAADFAVEEVPLYEPTGEGPHVYLAVTREELNTRDVAARLQSVFGVGRNAVGYAGLKDRRARATQTFSVELPTVEPEDAARRAAEVPALQVTARGRHANKLRRGHLAGNRFSILVRHAGGDAPRRAAEIVARLRETGVPNFYGPQRFGMHGDNAHTGRALVVGEATGRTARWTRRFMVAAYQAELFNTWLALRMTNGQFTALVTGDVAKVTRSGGLFTVEDLAREAPRFRVGEITYTGPLYGSRMRRAGGAAGSAEDAVLAAAGISSADFKRVGAKGSRRTARLTVHERGPPPGELPPRTGVGGLHVEPVREGLRLDFTLPKGAYATVVLRELMKERSDP